MLNKLFLYFSFLIMLANANGNKVKIAVIGGGIGGTTAAYELTNLALKNDVDFEIDLYEPGKIGGRLATINVNGYEFESGGSIIHSNNMYLRKYVEKFKLYKNTKTELDKEDLMGFYNGREFIYVESHFSFISTCKLLWRYGMDLINLDYKIADFLSNFNSVYQYQSNQEVFSDVHDFLNSINSEYPRLLNISIKKCLSTQGIGKRYLEEFVFIATNVNYNQDLNIHAFVGAVALAGSSPNALWSVRGGNYQVPQQLLKHSDALLIKSPVQSVVLLPDSRYGLQVEDSTKVYDYVIVACPLIEESVHKITFANFTKPIYPNVEYQETIVTIVHGELNNTYFNCHSQFGCPNNIFSVNRDSFFNSICVLDPVTPDKTYDRKVFKIFSKRTLSNAELNSVFASHDIFSTVTWFAYPKYDHAYRNLPFQLHENLYYVNNIEWVASSMEMSVISGVNAALSVIKKILYKNQYVN